MWERLHVPNHCPWVTSYVSARFISTIYKMHAESMARKKCLLFVFKPRNILRLQPVEQIYHQCLASCRPPWPPNSPPCICMHIRSSKTMQVGATQGTYTVSSGGPVLNTITAVPAITRVWHYPRNGSGLVTSGRGAPPEKKTA